MAVRVRRLRDWRTATLVAALVLANAKLASAKDLAALAELVVPAYTAMNFAVVCSTRPSGFLSETGGPLGTALTYAERVKNEIIESLDHDEAVFVLRVAADAARSTVLRIIRQFSADEPSVAETRIKGWCDTDARDFVRAFVDQYGRDHDKFLERLNKSKR